MQKNCGNGSFFSLARFVVINDEMTALTLHITLYKLCDIQGRLFELSLQLPCGSTSFMKAFMNSKLAVHLDSNYNRMQWAGEEYLLEELLEERKDDLEEGEQYSGEVLYWAGYIYRYWHYFTGEDSRKIYRQAGAATMKRNYMMFHTLDPEIAVEDLKEIYRQKCAKKKAK